jgi:hypothetical protein
VLVGLKALAGFMGRFDAISTMHAHAHLGGVGFFLMLIVGVSYKLVPMFTLSEVQSERRACWSLRLLNVGLAGAFFTILLRSPLKPVFALVLIAGLAVYGWEMRAILRARKRRVLDWGLKYFLTAISLLGLQAILAVVLVWPELPLTAVTGQLENLYGFLALIGIVTFAILGMLYKIIPFLVWYARYSRDIGRQKVPALADLYSARLQAAGYWTYLAGLLGVGVAIGLGSERAMPWCAGQPPPGTNSPDGPVFVTRLCSAPGRSVGVVELKLQNPGTVDSCDPFTAPWQAGHLPPLHFPSRKRLLFSTPNGTLFPRETAGHYRSQFAPWLPDPLQRDRLPERTRTGRTLSHSPRRVLLCESGTLLELGWARGRRFSSPY